MTRDHEFTKLFTKTPEFQEVYEAKLSSSLIASKMIGNLYTASLYLGFRSALEFEFQKGVDLEGKRFGFGSSHTAENYVSYLKQTYLLLGIHKFSFKSHL